MTTAFDPLDLAGMRMRNRIAMAPIPRSRAYGSGQTPTPLMATYYAQRATAGLPDLSQRNRKLWRAP